MLSDLAHTLLGAALVFLGVIASGLADRIRAGVRAGRVTRERRELAQVSDHLVRRRAPEVMPVTSAQTAMARDVAAALVQMGFTKAVAAEAVAGCPSSACSTSDAWLRAALKRTQKTETAS